MTPRNPWHSRWRDTIIPILWLLAACVLIGVALGSGISQATPTSGQQFADEHAADICVVLDTHPTVGGIIDILETLRADGLSDHESIVALVDSVYYVCPGHVGLLRQVAAQHKKVNA